ncbi:hypothetical protein [Pseudonocardia alaniniphila]|uniref:Uncharacterized protein n=1 Tax=Pseudonocardia alaniniphila TaxID=75291 RepID=A0ABS9TV45_9PSEU|nr:hypothetical protein [Pseudonocardia alaniniphila]MCH6172435.1 hypothetical protein [Pseudonocardia alaniniphila]
MTGVDGYSELVIDGALLLLELPRRFARNLSVRTFSYLLCPAFASSVLVADGDGGGTIGGRRTSAGAVSSGHGPLRAIVRPP